MVRSAPLYDCKTKSNHAPHFAFLLDVGKTRCRCRRVETCQLQNTYTDFGKAVGQNKPISISDTSSISEEQKCLNNLAMIFHIQWQLRGGSPVTSRQASSPSEQRGDRTRRPRSHPEESDVSYSVCSTLHRWLALRYPFFAPDRTS